MFIHRLPYDELKKVLDNEDIPYCEIDSSAELMGYISYAHQKQYCSACFDLSANMKYVYDKRRFIPIWEFIQQLKIPGVV